MALECNYSYKDLYKAAFGKEPTFADLKVLKNLPYPTRERVVQNWIERAGWISKTVHSDDGKSYRMFKPPSALDADDEEVL
ncbi:MAG: hypothetical protein WDZ82_01145 [Candidatus Paceibacterota bacterium]